MKSTFSNRLGKSTYNSGNPLSYITIPDLRKMKYNFNMPKFGPDGQVIKTNNIINNRYNEKISNNNNKQFGQIHFDINQGENTDIPVVRQRNAPKENETQPPKLGETYIHQEEGKRYIEGNHQAGKSSGNMLRSSVVKQNINASLKKSNLPSVGNKCVLQNSSVIQINTKFNFKDIENLKGSINAGIGGKKSASRLYASNKS